MLLLWGIQETRACGRGLDSIREVGMGWRPSFRVFSGCQSQDSTKKMDDPSSPVSPDSAGPQLLSISTSFAAPLQLFFPPFRSVSRPGRCSASACAPQDECRGGKRGGRWGRGGDNRLPGGSTQQKEFHINAPLYWATARRHLSWKQKRCFIDPHRDR